MKLHSKCKLKYKNIQGSSQKIVVANILDTDDDMGDMDDLTDIPVDDNSSSPPPKKCKFDPFASKSVLDAEGSPMFDPSHSTSKLNGMVSGYSMRDYISSRLRLPLDKQIRSKLKSECPRPSLPSNITSTQSIDLSLLTFFSKFGKDPHKGIDKAWSTCQDKLLDIVGPLARIFDMAEVARLENLDINHLNLSLWIQRAFCFMGNANLAITHERRKSLLKLDPKLANLATMVPKMVFFSETFIKDLSRYDTTFSSIDKAQQSLKVFSQWVFSRAGRSRSHFNCSS